MTDLFSSEQEVRFEDLVGEGKKFRDPDAVAKKIVHADQHISNLEKELAEMRQELQTRLTVEEMMEKLESKAPTREIPDTPRQEPGKEKDIDLTSEVQKLLKQEKEKERRETNIATSRAGLKERFGADYNQRLKSIAEELSVSEEFLTQMAASSPSGFLKLVDSVAKPDDNRPTTPPKSAADPLKLASPDRKNKAYYEKIRKENPALYFSRRVQNEMHNEAVKQGAAFFQ